MINDSRGYRPYNVDYKTGPSRQSLASSLLVELLGGIKGLTRRMHRQSPMIDRRSPFYKGSSTKGAVRLNAKKSAPGNYSSKLRLALAAIVTGILLTSVSEGKFSEMTSGIAALNISAPTLSTPAAPAAPKTPTFFFDDATNALGQAAESNEQVAAGDLMDQLDSLSPAELATNKTTAISEKRKPTGVAALREKTIAPEGSTETIVKVKSGDTLSRILNDRGVNVDQMPKLLTDEVVKKYLATLRIGLELKIVQLADGSFHSLTARVGQNRRVTVRKSISGFATASIDLPVEKERVVTSGTIEQSLYLAAEEAKLKQSTIMELADIFQWELDFARDIRKGDQFSLVYDRLYREGKYIGDGEILAAEFIRGGRSYRAIRFTSADGDTGYYTPDGQSKRRTFLRHPVDVVRVTSKFDPNRVHPVLHQIRAHKGVDYGSPYGSPIRATADGKVKYSGTKSAYGKTVILQHGNNISTLYAHMSKISGKSKVGKRVKQGDVIGYVGKTGRVTGTHLHYEFRKKGVHVDPLKVEFPAAAPLPKQYRAQLRQVSNELLAQMRSVVPAEARVAKAN